MLHKIIYKIHQNSQIILWYVVTNMPQKHRSAPLSYLQNDIQIGASDAEAAMAPCVVSKWMGKIHGKLHGKSHLNNFVRPNHTGFLSPIGSMYGIYGNIYHQYTPNVSIYTIHGSYGSCKTSVCASIYCWTWRYSMCLHGWLFDCQKVFDVSP